MHPRTIVAPHPLQDVVQRDEELLVAHSKGVDVYAPDGARRSILHGGDSIWRQSRFVELRDGRLLLHPATGPLQVVYEDRFEPVHDLGELTTFGGVLVTESGFIAWYKNGATVLIDERGERRVLKSGIEFLHGVVALPDDRLLAYGTGGWGVLTLDGATVLRGQETLRALLWCGESLVATISYPKNRALRFESFDSSPQQVELPDARSRIAFDDGVLALSDDAIRLFDLDDSERGYRLRWRIETLSAPKRAWACGSRAVITTGTRVMLVSGGSDVRDVSLDGLRFAKSDEDGIILVSDAMAVVWTPGATTELDHDFGPHRVTRVPAGLATIETEVLRVFDGKGHPPPELELDVADPPLETTVIVNGFVGERVTDGRYAYALERPEGGTMRVARGTPYRLALDEEAGTALMAQLVARRCNADLSKVPEDHLEARALPPSTMATLQQRALLQAGSLSKKERAVATMARGYFLSELANALGVSRRVVLAAICLGRYPLEGPRVVPNYEYLGSFECTGALRMSDPCYAANEKMRVEVGAKAGTWHAYVSSWKHPSWGNRVGELVCVHDTGFEIAATQPHRGDGPGIIGTVVGVDSGTAGIYDVSCNVPDATEVTGVTDDGLGFFTESGLGDGAYFPFLGKRRGVVVKVRLPFIDGTEDDSSVVSAPVDTSDAKPYSPRTTFSEGDVIEHSKFGAGRVIEASHDRIVVVFDSMTRTLVHGR